MRFFGLFAAALCCLTACRSSGTKSVSRPNVLLVTIDTLRADRVGAYGYKQIETPNLDRLAQSGVLFENAIAQAPLTTPSHASIMTGLYPTKHGVRDTGGFVLPSSATTLATVLQSQGWETAAFIGASVLKKRFGLDQGFNTYDDEMPSPDAAERTAAQVVDRALGWLNSQNGKPFLLWVHVYDPHLPYQPPSPVKEKFTGRPYDGEVAWTDSQIGRLLDAVGAKGNTLAVVLSDHGESFSEHGEYAHGVFLYDTTLRIPLIIAGPGVPAGVRVKQQVSTVDVLPTVLGLLKIPVPDAVQGASVVPAFTGKTSETSAYLETMFPRLNMGWSDLRGVRTNRWKYIHAPQPELYDLVNDPGELTNVAADHKQELTELQARLQSDNAKVEPAPMDPQTLHQLRSLGYLGGGAAAPQTSASPVDPKDRKAVLKLLNEGLYSGKPLAERITALRRAVAEDPKNPSLYSNLGDLYAEASRPAEALKLYQSAMNNGIRSAWLFSRMGQLCLRQGKKNDAIPLFEAAAQLNPSDYESLQNLSVAYRETGRVDDAEAILNSIVKSGEEYAPAYNELGMVLYQKGNLTSALAYFEKAARLDPTYQLNLGRMYKMQGDRTKARAAFEAFLTTKGSSPAYREIVPVVKREIAALQ